MEQPDHDSPLSSDSLQHHSQEFEIPEQEQSNDQHSPPIQIHHHHISEIEEENLPTFDTFQHQAALEIIFKISERSYSRHFMKGLTFAFIQSLKNEQKTIVVAHPPLQPIRKWPFQQLYEKQYRSPQEEEMLQFVNLCAVMIQANFKGFITRKRHRMALQRTKKAHQNLVSFVRMWKASRIYNCRKCFSERMEIRRIDQQLQLQEQNFTTRDPKKIKQLHKHYQIKTRMFRDAFFLLMDTGTWVFEDNMKPRRRPLRNHIKNVQIPHMRQQNSPPFEKKSGRQINRYESQEAYPIKENISDNYVTMMEANQSNFSTFEEDRPIKAKGQYLLNQGELPKEAFAPPPKPQPQQRQDMDDQHDNVAKREQKNKQMKKREKRQKYDPRKAIQEQKKRKQQQKGEPKPENTSNLIEGNEKQQRVKTQNSNYEQNQSKMSKKSVTPKTDANQKSNQKKKVVIAKNSGQKKITSKVDCWPNKKQEEADWVKECKMRIMEENRRRGDGQNLRRSVERFEEERRSIEKKYANLVRKEEFQQKYESREQPQAIKSWQRAELQNLKQKQQQITINRKSSTQNLQDQVRNIVERNLSKKKESHRPIDELEDAHSKHYGDRFQNLMPKLSLLAVARDEQRQSGIPVVDNDSEEFAEWFHAIYNSTQFWNLASQLQRVYKSFVLH